MIEIFSEREEELELLSWLDHRVFGLVKKFVDQERESCVRDGS